jgi:hypothetical protein
MNEERRIRIKALCSQAASLVSELVSIADAEKAAFESTPSGLKYSNRGTDSGYAWGEIDDLANTISNAVAKLEQLVESI